MLVLILILRCRSELAMPNIIMAGKPAAGGAFFGAKRAVITLRRSAKWEVHWLMGTWLVVEIKESLNKLYSTIAAPRQKSVISKKHITLV